MKIKWNEMVVLSLNAAHWKENAMFQIAPGEIRPPRQIPLGTEYGVIEDAHDAFEGADRGA